MGLQAGELASVSSAIASWQHRPGALLPILHTVQSALGHIPEDAVPEIARALNLSRAEVHGVISFYHDFLTAPPGRHRVQICRAEACQAVGARELERHATELLATPMGATSEDGSVTLEGVYCLGNCACGPSVRIGDRVYGRVDRDALAGLLQACREEPAP
jgi:formate dehydrogenase subunit gamma